MMNIIEKDGKFVKYYFLKIIIPIALTYIFNASIINYSFLSPLIRGVRKTCQGKL
jgi:hypothetical protein